MKTKIFFGTNVFKVVSILVRRTTMPIVLLLVSLFSIEQAHCQNIEVNSDYVILRSKSDIGQVLLIPGGQTLVEVNDAQDWYNCFMVRVPQNLTRAISVFQSWGGGVTFEVFGDGTAYTKGVVVTSDSTAKKDIRQLDSQMDKIKKVKGVSYQWKEEKEAGIKGNKRTYGVIAQDLEKIYPDMVFTNDKDEKGVYYHELTIVLLEAVKEQQSQIEQQQAAIEAQAKVLADLEKRMLKLEKKEKETSK
jgi:hypothetical protein